MQKVFGSIYSRTLNQCLAVIFILGLSVSISWGASLDWERVINGSASTDVKLSKMVADSFGNVYLGGLIVPGKSGGNLSDFCTVKLLPTGDTAWVRTYDGDAKLSDRISAIAVDEYGNVYSSGFCETGYSSGPDIVTIKYSFDGEISWVKKQPMIQNYAIPFSMAVADSGDVYLTWNQGMATIVVKYFSNGEVAWTNSYYNSSGGQLSGRSIVIGESESIYIVGSASDTVSINGSLKYLGRIMVMMLYPNGDTAWVRASYGYPYDPKYGTAAFANQLCFDGTGNIYITGYINGVNHNYDIVTLKYGNDGAFYWAKEYNGTANGYDYGMFVKSDPLGNVYVLGNSSGAGTGMDYVLIKYYADGDMAWNQVYNGSANMADSVCGLQLDPNGFLYVSGTSTEIGTKDNYTTIKYDFDGNTEWLKYFNRSDSTIELAVGLGLDNNGNIYVAGYGTCTPDYVYGYDIVTIKYLPTGDTEWTSIYDGYKGAHDWVADIATDDNGNIYITGSASRSLSTYWYSYHYVTTKYGANGDLIWSKEYNGQSDSLFKSGHSAKALALDKAGYIYVTGGSDGIGKEKDIATIKYTEFGDEVWIRRYDGQSGADLASDMDIDSAGNIYITGSTTNTVTNQDWITIKYMPDGSSDWIRTFDGGSNANDAAMKIAVDINGNAYVIGKITNSTGAYYCTIKYNSYGDTVWTRSYGMPNNNIYQCKLSDIDVDIHGNIYVTGTTHSLYSHDDILTVKYFSNGDIAWENQYNGPVGELDEAKCVAIDVDGNAYVSGISGSDRNSASIITIKYDSNGAQQWLTPVNGIGGMEYRSPDIPCMMVDAMNNIFIGATTSRDVYNANGTWDDYSIVKYFPNGDTVFTYAYSSLPRADESPVGIASDCQGGVIVTGKRYYDYELNDVATIKIGDESIYHDFGIAEIITPVGIVGSGTIITPRVVVKNTGQATEECFIVLRIGNQYYDSINVLMEPGQRDTVEFKQWIAEIGGSFAVICTAGSATDQDTTNNLIVSSVTIETIGPIIAYISPDHGGNTGLVSIDIYGDRFIADAQVRLYRMNEGNTAINSITTYVVDSTHLISTFPLMNADYGTYNIVVANSIYDSTIYYGAYTVEPGTDSIAIEIEGRQQILVGLSQNYLLKCRNVGNMNVYDIQLWLSAPLSMQIGNDALRVFGAPDSIAPVPIDDEQVNVFWIYELRPGQEVVTKLTFRLPVAIEDISIGMSNADYFGSIPLQQYRTAGVLRNRLATGLSPDHFEPPADAVGAALFVAPHAGNPFGHLATYGGKDENGNGIVYDHYLGGYMSFTGWKAHYEGQVEKSKYMGYGLPPGYTPELGQAMLNEYKKLLINDIPFAWWGGKSNGPDDNASCVGGWEQSWEAVGLSPAPNGEERLPPLSPAGLYMALTGRFDFFEEGRSHLSPPENPVKLYLDAVLVDWHEIFVEASRELIDAKLAVKAFVKELQSVQSIDPNDKEINGGYVGGRYVIPGQELKYFVYFENVDTATASASNIIISDTLDEDLDWSTLIFGDVFPGAGPDNIRPNYLETRNFDPATGVLTWNMANINLPPDTAPYWGEGWVSYTINTKFGLTSGTIIQNIAAIKFDYNPWILAPMDSIPIVSIVDAGPPNSSVLALPDTTYDSIFVVSWMGWDDPGGSGIASYTIYSSEDGGEFCAWLADSNCTSASFIGRYGHTYEFYSVAKDSVGHTETIPEGPDARTLTAEGYTKLSGFVTDESWGILLGIGLDLYTYEGELLMSTVTDDSGFYSIDSIPHGHYAIALITPLGYEADQETKEFTTPNGELSIDFHLTRLDITPRQRSRGYWAMELNRALCNIPHDYTKAQFSRLASLIAQHFNNNLINPVENYVVSQPATQADSLNVLKKLLNFMPMAGNESFLKRIARSELMALMLNVVASKVSQTHFITQDSMTISQAITYCDMLVNDLDCPIGFLPDNFMTEYPRLAEILRYLKACYVAGLINVGVILPAGTIPPDIMNIAYRQAADNPPVPADFDLAQNYPNPFNPNTQIDFSLPTSSHVSIEIYNVLGQRVRTLLDEERAAGTYSITWDGKDQNGSLSASGVYFYRLVAGDFIKSRKMLLMK